MSDRQELIKKIAVYDFAVTELNLYLDTHPNDVDAHRKLEDYEEKSAILREDYENMYGPIIFRDSPENLGIILKDWKYILVKSRVSLKKSGTIRTS